MKSKGRDRACLFVGRLCSNSFGITGSQAVELWAVTERLTGRAPAPFHWNWVLEIAAGALLSKVGGRQTDCPKCTLFLDGKHWLIRGETAHNTDLSSTDPDLKPAGERQEMRLPEEMPSEKHRHAFYTPTNQCLNQWLKSENSIKLTWEYIFELTLHQWLLKCPHPQVKM